MSVDPRALHGGTSYCPRRRKFRAKLWIRDSDYHLGWYANADEGQLGYDTAVALLLKKPLPSTEKVSPERIAQIREWLSRLLANLIFT